MLVSKHIEDTLVKVSDVIEGKVSTGYGGNPDAMIYDPKPKILGIRGVKSSSNYYIEQLQYDNDAPDISVIPEYRSNLKLFINDLVKKEDRIFKVVQKHRSSSRIPLTNTDYYTEIDYYKI